MKTWDDIRKKAFSPEELAEQDELIARDVTAELTMRELRKALGKTQEEMAEVAQMSQSELSKVERRDDLHLSTMRSYVEALGGELELYARIDGRRVRLRVAEGSVAESHQPKVPVGLDLARAARVQPRTASASWKVGPRSGPKGSKRGSR